VKVWIYKGEAPTSRAGREAQAAQAALRAAGQQRGNQRPRDRDTQRRRRAPETAAAGQEG
jgi:small subunit ribosomal protein S3